MGYLASSKVTLATYGGAGQTSVLGLSWNLLVWPTVAHTLLNGCFLSPVMLTLALLVLNTRGLWAI